MTKEATFGNIPMAVRLVGGMATGLQFAFMADSTNTTICHKPNLDWVCNVSVENHFNSKERAESRRILILRKSQSK